MSEKILVPTLGESVTEATVSKWLKNQGEEVSADEPIVELETDKVNVEVPSPSNGVLEKISVKEGETVNVGALLGMINGSAIKIEKDIQEVKKYSPPPKKNKVEKPKTSKQIIQKKEEPLKLEEEPLKLEETLNLEEQEPLVLNETVEKNEIKEELEIKNLSPRISPAARKMATETKVNLQNIQGSGKDGFILKEDILSLMNYKQHLLKEKLNMDLKKESK